MAPGAAMGFMVAGGITSIPASMAVFALARKAVFAWYLALAAVGALVLSYLYQALWVLF